MDKSADAYRTISEVAEELDLPQHVLRFWETRFPHIKPLKRAGGRRYYRPQDIELLRAIKQLLYGQGYTIKGVQRILKEQGARAVTVASQGGSDFGPPAVGQPPLLQVEPSWSDDEVGRGAEARPAETRAQLRGAGVAAEHLMREGDAAARLAGPEPAWPTALSAEDAASLRSVLAELEECERILEDVRRG